MLSVIVTTASLSSETSTQRIFDQHIADANTFSFIYLSMFQARGCSDAVISFVQNQSLKPKTWTLFFFYPACTAISSRKCKSTWILSFEECTVYVCQVQDLGCKHKGCGFTSKYTGATQDLESNIDYNRSLSPLYPSAGHLTPGCSRGTQPAISVL